MRSAVDPGAGTRPVAWGPVSAWVLVCVALAHAPSLGGGFVWDDVILLRDQPALHRVETAWEAAFADFFPSRGDGAGGGYLRPIPVLLNALTWQSTGGAPWAFRLGNLLVHLASVALLMSLLRRWGVTAFAAAVGAAFFGLHPALTEAVDFISGRTDLLAGFFVLVALTAVVRAVGSWPGLAAAGLAAALALASKEVALGAWPALVLAAPQAHRRRVALVLGGVAACMVTARLVADVPAPERLFFPSTALPVVVPGLVAFYGRLALLPDPLQAVYALPGLASPGVETLVGVVLVGFALWGALRGSGKIRLGIALAAGTLAPVLHLVPISTLVAPRYLYLPLLGGALLVASAAERLPGRWPRALLALPLLGLMLTPMRAADWRSETTLWTAELAVEPESFVAHQNLGAAYAEAGDLDRATFHLREAARHRPEDALTQRNLLRLERLRARPPQER